MPSNDCKKKKLSLVLSHTKRKKDLISLYMNEPRLWFYTVDGGILCQESLIYQRVAKEEEEFGFSAQVYAHANHNIASV